MSDGQEPEKSGNLAITAAPTNHSPSGRFYRQKASFSPSQEPEKTPEKYYCVTGAQEGRLTWEQGLTKQGKDHRYLVWRERPPYPYPHPQHRLEKASACIQPPLSGDLPADRQTRNRLHGFDIEKGRFSFRLHRPVTVKNAGKRRGSCQKRTMPPTGWNDVDLFTILWYWFLGNKSRLREANHDSLIVIKSRLTTFYSHFSWGTY